MLRILALTAALLMQVLPAQAFWNHVGPCSTAEEFNEIVNDLGKNFVLVLDGFIERSDIPRWLLLYVNKEDGTWTLLVRNEGGETCLLLVGRDIGFVEEGG